MMYSEEKLSKQEIEFLAVCYKKLQQNKTYLKYSRQLHDYIDEFLTEQLLLLRKNKLLS